MKVSGWTCVAAVPDDDEWCPSHLSDLSTETHQGKEYLLPSLHE